MPKVSKEIIKLVGTSQSPPGSNQAWWGGVAVASSTSDSKIHESRAMSVLSTTDGPEGITQQEIVMLAST